MITSPEDLESHGLRSLFHNQYGFIFCGFSGCLVICRFWDLY